MPLSSSTLRKAAELQEQIERLGEELAALLHPDGSAAATASNLSTPAPAPVKGQGRGRKPTAAQTPQGPGRRSSSPSGPLAPAVVTVLRAQGVPMGVSEILEALLASGYQYRAADPKKNLFARIYRLKGVKQVGPGQFTAG